MEGSIFRNFRFCILLCAGCRYEKARGGGGGGGEWRWTVVTWGRGLRRGLGGRVALCSYAGEAVSKMGEWGGRGQLGVALGEGGGHVVDVICWGWGSP